MARKYQKSRRKGGYRAARGYRSGGGRGNRRFGGGGRGQTVRIVIEQPTGPRPGAAMLTPDGELVTQAAPPRKAKF